jgi:hypothetical protein
MKRSQKHQPSRKQRHIQTAKNLAKGLSPVSAMIEAGYSESYARSQGYTVVKRPYVRSIVTDAIEQVLKVQNKEFVDIIQPYIDGLDAPVVVKSPTDGTASIAVDPDTQQIIPDHDVRIEAADRIIGLYGGVPEEVEIPIPPARGLTVIINKDGGAVQVNRQTNQTSVNRTKIVPTGESNGDVMPKIRITRQP